MKIKIDMTKYMLKLRLICCLVLMTPFVYAQVLKTTELICEYQHNPLVIDVQKPRLGWKIESPLRDVMQTAYEVRVGTDKELSGKNVVWSSGKVTSDQSVHIAYEGPALQSKQRYYWQVQVWDNQGNTSGWSDVNFWQMGLLNPDDWKAKWITPSQDDTVKSPLVRKEVHLSKKLKTAFAHITVKGLYEAYINGQKLGDSYFTPGWTNYNHHIQYQTYDVTEMLKNGANAIGVMLGDGWYRGYLGWQGKKNLYGRELGLLMQIELEYTDGSRETITTDDSWRSSFGAILESDIYNGEVYDARLEKKGWKQAGFKEDDSWENMRLLQTNTARLVAPLAPPVRKQEILKPIEILTTPKGETVVDFGQNLVGWVQLKAKGASGTKIRITHAEVLDKEGNFYMDNLRTAKQENTYILKGEGEELFEPHFTFQGFRYARVEGYTGDLKAENISAVVLNSDMETTGQFKTSNALINQLQHNILWSQKGNFLDVPTDCPQRDERMGWTGDAQAFYNTAAFNMDVAGFFRKWLNDLKVEQREDGAVPHVVPNVLESTRIGTAGWGDASTIVPWGMYETYGDTQILADQYASMKGWVDFMLNSSENYLWNKGFHYGDWLFYRPAGDDNDGRSAVTDKYLIAQAFMIHSTNILVRSADLLGNTADSKKYAGVLEKIKQAFLEEYVTPNGRLISGTQTAYVLALAFDVLPENLRQQAAKRLVDNIESYKNHLTTGFLGTPHLCHVLTKYGYTDVAYKLLLQDTYPSWLYPVKKGATTIWERWDGIKPDGSFQNTHMNSFNHYSYGAIGDWMYKTIGGIRPNPEAVGYKRITIKPELGGGFEHAETELKTLYGKVKTSWKIGNGQFTIEVVIPPNTTADVVLPKASLNNVTENNVSISEAKDIRNPVQVGEDVSLEVGSGSYLFQYRLN